MAFALLFVPTASLSQSPVISADGFLRAHRPVSTSVPAAQAAFEDGLTLLYAYNPESARAAFKRALAADPTLAMAWWGIAMSHGPNINTDYDAGEATNGSSAIETARALDATATPVERALIEAAQKRFAHHRQKDGDASARAYRDAMIAAAAQFPDDDDAATLAAEAAMDVRPWAYYKDDGTPETGTLEIVARLKRVLARDPAHIGAEHFLIHAVEASKAPEDALDAARRLAADSFEPGAEHLTHMPAHAFERVGAYHEAGEANARAVTALDTFLESTPGAVHGDYLGHDCLFGVDAFMMSGEYGRALSLAQTCEQHDSGHGLARVVQLRFHHWDAIGPGGQGAFVTGMLELHENNMTSAMKRGKELAAQDSTAAQIEGALVAAQAARQRGDLSTELASLTHAVALQDRDGYREPPAFFYPAREALGAAELRAASAREAAATFRADLEKNPNNPRSLFGLAIALERLGDRDGASDARARYTIAWARAGAPLTLEDL